MLTRAQHLVPSNKSAASTKSAVPTIRTCAQCPNPIPRGQGKGHRLYCSPGCKDSAHKTPISPAVILNSTDPADDGERKCAGCGESMHPSARRDRRTCSGACRKRVNRGRTDTARVVAVADDVDDKPSAVIDPRTEALRDLEFWASVYADRDRLVLQAEEVGVGVNEIARVMGIAKTTVLRVVHPAS